MQIVNHPRLVLTPAQNLLIQELVQKAVDKGFGECSWLGFGKPDQQDFIFIDEIHTPAQENTSGNSEMDEEDVHRICMDMVDKGLRLLWWGHSHARMQTFFSGTDESTWKMFTSAKPPLFFATVHNYKKEATYDRMYWKDLDLKGSGQLIYVIPPALDEDEVESHMANWRKPKRGSWPRYTSGKALPGGKASGSASGTNKQQPGHGKKRRKKSFQSSSTKTSGGKAIVWSPLVHDGAETENFFQMPQAFLAPDAVEGQILGRICDECDMLQVATIEEARLNDTHSCSICHHEQPVSNRIFKSPNNVAKLVDDFKKLVS